MLSRILVVALLLTSLAGLPSASAIKCEDVSACPGELPPVPPVPPLPEVCDGRPLQDCLPVPCEGQTLEECLGVDLGEVVRQAVDLVLLLAEDADDDGVSDYLEARACGVPALHDEIATGGQMHCASGTDLAVHPSTSGVDADGDDIPDVLEQLVCGPALVRNNLGTSTQARCDSASDLVVAPDTTVVTDPVFWVVGLVLDALSPYDQDGDLVLDDLEPWVCQVENPNFAEDGSCDATLTDYTPPA